MTMCIVLLLSVIRIMYHSEAFSEMLPQNIKKCFNIKNIGGILFVCTEID